MAWREKTAWITLVTMVIAYGAYFTVVSTVAMSGVSMLGLFGAVTVAQVIVIIVATAVLAALSADDARAKADERDRAISRRGTNVAYFVLMSGVVTVGVIMPFHDVGWRLTNAALFALVIAEAVRHLIIVVSYRRGWHG